MISKRGIRKYISKEIRRFLGRGFKVHVSRRGVIENPGEFRKSWTLDVWEWGSSRDYGMRVMSLDWKVIVPEFKEMYIRCYGVPLHTRQ